MFDERSDKMERTMVKLKHSGNCIGIRTISRTQKAPHWFYLTRRETAQLESQEAVIVRDLYSFADLHREPRTDILSIRFAWLTGDAGCGTMQALVEDIDLSWSAFFAFVHDLRSQSIALLSLPDPGKPRMDFTNASRTLRHVAADPTLRHKLSVALRDNFNWPKVHDITVYSDWGNTDFSFMSKKPNGEYGVCGGLLLHQSEKRGPYYAVHT